MAGPRPDADAGGAVFDSIVQSLPAQAELASTACACRNPEGDRPVERRNENGGAQNRFP